MIKMPKKKLCILIVITMILSSVLTVAGISVFRNINNYVVVKESEYDLAYDIAKKYSKLYMIQEKVNERFLWKTDEEKQMDTIYKSLLNSLGDEYSVYMNEEEFAEWQDYVTGVFTGIGITFRENEKKEFEIISVADNSPASSAGLKAGDIIIKVDGKTFNNSTDASKSIRGEEGSTVKITYSRNGKTKDVSIVRAVVEEKSVFVTDLDKNYGYIRITGFEKSTEEQFKTELASFENKGFKGIVIDLRNNPGGLMESGVSIADMLLPECTITHTEDKKGKKEYYNSDEKSTKLKYVLLVNENTASTSEILAAAVKDNNGGAIVGTKTFGKGIIQSTMEMTDHSALKLTTMQYFSPENKEIHKVGITPDYVVKLPENAKTDLQLKKAIEVLKDGN